jgi:hypothetical protein
MAPSLLVVSNEPYHPSLGTTNRQRLARAAALDGWDVTYIETIGWGYRPSGTGDYGIEVSHSLNFMPFAAQPARGSFRGINQFLTSRKPGIRKPFQAVVTYDPFSRSLLQKLQPSRTVYDCVDAYEFQPQYAHPSNQDRLRSNEKSLALTVDICVSTSPELSALKAKEWGVHVHTLVGALERPQTRLELEGTESRLRNSPEQTALLVTALDGYKFDPLPVMSWIDSNPDWNITVAGREIHGGNSTIKEFLSHGRVNFVGSVKSEDVPELAKGASFGWVSLTNSPYSRYSFPLKTWDYMFAGLPVLAANAPSLEGIPGVTSFDSNVASHHSYYEKNLYRFLPSQLRAIAEANDATSRWNKLKELL